MTVGASRTAGARAGSGESPLPWLATALEAVVGNRLGAGVYRRWVESLGLSGAEDVLDIGTGAGACARHVAARLTTGSLTCVDVDGRWLAIARRRLARYGSRVRFLERDATMFSLPCAFDVVTAHFVLHDLDTSGRASALRRAADSLRPDGRLCLREPVAHGMTAQELMRQLDEAGFERIASFGPTTVPLMGEVLSGAWRISER